MRALAATLAGSLIALLLLLAVPCAAQAQTQTHAELVVGCDASGKLRVLADATVPYPVPASRFPGIEGYAEVFPGFSTAIGARAAPDFRPLDAQAEIVFVLVGAETGIAVWNDHGTATMQPGERFVLGHPPFDSHPVWNIRAGETGRSYALRLQLRDTSGRYADSEVFAPAFAPDDATEVFTCPMSCRGGSYYSAAGVCPECGMWLKLLSGRHYRVAVTVDGATDRRPRAGEPATLRLQLESPAGEPVTELEVVHEKLLHLLMVSNDLSWFAHEHPVRQADGSFLLSFSFPHAGQFTLFHDFTPPRVGMQVVAAELQVEGDAPAPAPTPLRASGERSQVVDGYTVTLTAPPAPMALVMQELSFRLERDGQPVTDLQPFLGTLGHLIVLSEDRRHFVHSHPLVPVAGAASTAGAAGAPDTVGAAEAPQPARAEAGPTVVFSALFPAPGKYKAWGQFQHRDHVITAAFVLEVQAPH